MRAILASRFAPMPIACAVLLYLADEAHQLVKSSKHALKAPDQAIRGTRAQLLAQGPPEQTPQHPPAPVPGKADVPKIVTVVWSPIPMVIANDSPSSAEPGYQRAGNAGNPTPTASGPSAAAVQSATPLPKIAGVPVERESAEAPPAETPVSEGPNVATMVANALNTTHAAQAKIPAAGTTPVPRPKAMTMLSISLDENKAAPTDLSIRCRTCGQLINVAGTDRVFIVAVVTADVVSQAGKILIRAGSKVAGIGRTDLDNGRLQSHGNWSIIDGDHELRVPAEMQDEVSGFKGVAGKETSLGPQRDGRYFFLADKTPFVLSLKGEAEMAEVKALQSLQ
jgi:hypothetical protein